MKIHKIKNIFDIFELKLGIPQNYKQKCIKEAYNLGNSIENTKDYTNVKAIHSTYRVWQETKIYNPLLNNIKLSINKILTPTFNVSGIHQFILKTAWTAIYKKGSYADGHFHYPTHFSFVYYFQASGNTPLVFDHSDFQYSPQDDRLIIFPANLYHSVPPHTSDEDRICLAGNILML